MADEDVVEKETNPALVPPVGVPYVIFFEGLDGKIDQETARILAKNRGCLARFFRWEDWRSAVDLPRTNQGTKYHVAGFSRGAAPDVMGGFMTAVRHAGYRLPEDILTIGLYGPSARSFTHRYVDPDYECINYLDSSGQAHAGEHNAINLGPNVPHQGPGSGMELVAAKFANGVVPAEIVMSTPAAQDTFRAAAKAQAEAGTHSGAGPRNPAGIDLAALPKPDHPKWPKAGNDNLIAFYGDPNKTKAVKFVPPFQMIDEDTKKPIKSFDVHVKCLESFEGVFNELWQACGKDQATIEKYHLHLFNGSRVVRYIRGLEAQKIWSNHAFGAAIDINSEGAPMGVGLPRPSQDQVPDFAVYIWLRYGASWGGYYRGRKDYMHFEFVDEGQAEHAEDLVA